jgi:hypothetical protein
VRRGLVSFISSEEVADAPVSLLNSTDKLRGEVANLLGERRQIAIS